MGLVNVKISLLLTLVAQSVGVPQGQQSRVQFVYVLNWSDIVLFSYLRKSENCFGPIRFLKLLSLPSVHWYP